MSMGINVLTLLFNWIFDYALIIYLGSEYQLIECATNLLFNDAWWYSERNLKPIIRICEFQPDQAFSYEESAMLFCPDSRGDRLCFFCPDSRRDRLCFFCPDSRGDRLCFFCPDSRGDRLCFFALTHEGIGYAFCSLHTKKPLINLVNVNT